MSKGFLFLLAPLLISAQSYTSSTIAGWSGNSYVARITNGPNYVAVDPAGNVYTAAGDGVIYKLTPNLVPSIVGKSGFAVAIAVNGAGDVYIADGQAIQIVRVTPDGVNHAIPLPGLQSLGGMAIDYAGTLYVSDPAQSVIFRLGSGSATPERIAGIPTNLAASSGDGGSALTARLYQPTAVALDALGAVYFVESGGGRIRRISPLGSITTVAGNGTQGHTGDDGPALRASIFPSSLAADFAGNLYFSEAPVYNDIRRVDRNGFITRIVGQANGFGVGTGDNVPAFNQPVQLPRGIAADADGAVFFADYFGGRVYKIDTAGILHTIFGMLGGAFWGDGGPATLAGLSAPSGAVADAKGNVYFNDNGRVRKVDSQGIISTVLTAAQPRDRGDLAIDPEGNLWITNGSGIRVLKQDGSVTRSFLSDLPVFRAAASECGILDNCVARVIATFDPTGRGYLAISNRVYRIADDGNLTALPGTFKLISGIAADSAGNIFVADPVDLHVWKINFSGDLEPVAGGGELTASNDPVDPKSVKLYPNSIAVDRAGNLFIYSVTDILELTPDGLLKRIAGDGKQGYRGDGGPSTGTEFIAAGTLSVDGAGNIYVTDTQANAVRVLRPDAPSH